MNPESIIKLQNDLEALTIDVDDIKKIVNGLKLNEQRYVTKNNSIPPGIACKVAYDSNGLILSGIGLDPSDIPILGIDNINGLRSILEDKLDSSHMKKLQDEMKNIILKKGEAVNSGIKINYDSNGLIVSSSDLSIDDIPLLPISKIDGLSDMIEHLKSYHKSTNESTVKDINVNPGTFTKISFDEYGRVIKGDHLSLDDIPNELIGRINIIESKMVNLASQNSVDGLINSVSKKLDANDQIDPGEFTKVKVDSKGLIIKGSKLERKDLPNDVIEELLDIDLEIRSKVNEDDFIRLSDTVSVITNKLSDIVNMKDLESRIERKAEDSEVKLLSSRIESLQNLVDTLVEKIPNDTIMNQLELIETELSNLSGRIGVIERKLNTENKN